MSVTTAAGKRALAGGLVDTGVAPLAWGPVDLEITTLCAGRHGTS